MVTQHQFLLEIWLEYGLGALVYALRFFARWRLLGFRGWDWDDLFAGVSWALYTIDAALLTFVSEHGSNVGLNEQSALQLSSAEIHSFTLGSKALFAAWFTYLSLIWTLKGSVIGFYYRLTSTLWHQMFVKVMGVICVLCWMGMMVLIFARCTPIQRNWQIVPYAGDQCTLATSTYITLMVTNISTDAALIFIPAHILWIAKMPIRRKIGVGLLLSSSIFIIVCALIRGIVILEDVSALRLSFLWGTRETFITIVVTSVPLIKPLFSKRTQQGSSHVLTSGDVVPSNKNFSSTRPKKSTIRGEDEEEYHYNLQKLPPRVETSEYDSQSLSGSSRELVHYEQSERSDGTELGPKTSIESVSNPFEVNVTTEFSQTATVLRDGRPGTAFSSTAGDQWGPQKSHMTTRIAGGCPPTAD